VISLQDSISIRAILCDLVDRSSVSHRVDPRSYMNEHETRLITHHSSRFFKKGNEFVMTWIKTVSASEDENVRKASEAQRHLYPIEYATPIHPTPDGESSGIVESHSLIPDALYHAFATYGSLMSPDLPLQRHQHEMIATLVSVTNRCHY
jgi:hypothetical protein